MSPPNPRCIGSGTHLLGHAAYEYSEFKNVGRNPAVNTVSLTEAGSDVRDDVVVDLGFDGELSAGDSISFYRRLGASDARTLLGRVVVVEDKAASPSQPRRFTLTESKHSDSAPALAVDDQAPGKNAAATLTLAAAGSETSTVSFYAGIVDGKTVWAGVEQKGIDGRGRGGPADLGNALGIKSGASGTRVSQVTSNAEGKLSFGFSLQQPPSDAAPRQAELGEINHVLVKPCAGRLSRD